MIRMLWMSVRFGMSGLCGLALSRLNFQRPRQVLQPFHHEIEELLEQRMQIVRTGAGLRVPLEAEGRAIGARDTLERSIEERTEGRAQHRRQARLVDREPMVLRRDEHATAG